MLDRDARRRARPDRGDAGLRPAAIGAFVAAGLLYAATAARTVTFGDAGELIAASATLGVAHPPGYPLYTLLARAALALPIGEPAFRTNLLSGLAAAAACGLLATLLERAGARPWAAAAAGGMLAVSRTFWSSAGTTEVYALHALLLVGLLLAADAATRSPRGLVTLGGVLGIGLAHHPTLLLAAPAVAASMRGTRPKLDRRAALAGGLLAIAIPALFYLSLLARVRASADASWGVRSVQGLIAHATAGRYRVYDVGSAAWLDPASWTTALRLLLEDGGYVALPLGLAGLLLAPRAIRWTLGLLLAAGVAFGLRYATEDREVFFLPAFVALAALSGLAIDALERRGGRARASAAALAVVAITMPLALHRGSCDRRHDVAAREYGRDMLASLPLGATLFAEGDDTFLLAYLTRAVGERPDLTIVDRNGNLFAPFRGDEASFVARRLASEPEAPVCFMSWPGYAIPGVRFEPHGLLYRARPDGRPPLDDGAVRATLHEAVVVAEAERTRDLFARTVAATYAVMRGERSLLLGDAAAASSAFDEAIARAGDSETIRNTLGTIYGREGDLARAAREFERAIAAKPVSIRAWANLATARRLAGDARGAAEADARVRALSSR